MRQPKLTIIIPNYNHGSFLERAIISVANQDYPNKELIVVDGGSTDNSLEIIKRYSDQISLWISERDQGTFEANNKGLRKMTGDFWCVLNADDIFFPGALKTVADVILRNPGSKWLTGGQRLLDEQDQIVGTVDPIAPFPVAGYTFLAGCWIAHASTFLHRSVVDEVGLFAQSHTMDYEYWLRMEAAGFVPHVFPQYISALRVHKGAKSYNRVKLHEECLLVMKSFCAKKGLDSNEVRTRFKQEEDHIIRLRIAQLLKNKRRVKTISLLLGRVFKDPSTLSERWFWGSVKRVILGVSKADPINEDALAGEGSGNW